MVAPGPAVVPGLLAPVGSRVEVAALRRDPPAALEVMMWVPVVEAVVPPWTRSTCT